MSLNFCIRKLVQVRGIVIKVFYVYGRNRRLQDRNLRLQYILLLNLRLWPLEWIIKGLFWNLMSFITTLLLSLITGVALWWHFPEIILLSCLFLAVFGEVGEDASLVCRLVEVWGCLLVEEFASWFWWWPYAFFFFQRWGCWWWVVWELVADRDICSLFFYRVKIPIVEVLEPLNGCLCYNYRFFRDWKIAEWSERFRDCHIVFEVVLWIRTCEVVAWRRYSSKRGSIWSLWIRSL